MGLCSRIFSLPGLIVITSIFAAVYRDEIIQYAIENYEICPKLPEVSPPIVEVNGEEENKKKKDTSEQVRTSSDSPKYWLIADDVEEQLSPVKSVLDRAGLKQFNGSLKVENNHEGWNLIWSTKVNLALDWKQLKYHQKFNHFPWSKLLSSKSIFATTTNSRYVPRAFLDAEELKKYAKENPKSRFVKKAKSRGGVSIVKSVNKMNFTANDDYFVQELVQNPLTFDGRLFELSLFVVITSVNPLRLYYLPKTAVPRFCPENYDHEDFSDEDSFVVGESHVAPLDFEGTREYFLNAYNFKDAIDGYLRKQNADVEDLWRKIEDAIRVVVVSKEKSFNEYHEKIKEMKYPYFELYSFEFIIDSSYEPHIININANPDLSATGKYVRFRAAYENLLYNLFQLIGVATPYLKKDFLLENVELEMMVAHANMRNVMPEFCIWDCEGNCSGRCAFCMRCLKQNQFYETILMYLEQYHIGDFKRLFPPEKDFLNRVGADYAKILEDHSQFQLEYFIEMCKRNRRFC